MGDLVLWSARRRDVLGLSAALVGSVGLGGSAGLGAARGRRPSSPQAVPVTPPEDLMREHGVLRRILLIYREATRLLNSGEPVPSQELQTSACLVRDFVEDYHEQLEEKYVFPRLVQAGKLADTVSILLTQHQRGRVLTDHVIEFASKGIDDWSRQHLAADLAAFIRMYEPHAAREDTVVFPTFREVVPPQELLELGEIFEDEEERRFGPSGFTGIVDQVADVEKALGIYHLSQFTPPAQ